MESFDSIAMKIAELDSSLNPMIQAIGKKWEKDLDGLDKKVMQVTKRKNETAISKLEKSQRFLFPDRVPQERHQNFLALMDILGEKGMDLLKENFSEMGNQVLLLKE